MSMLWFRAQTVLGQRRAGVWRRAQTVASQNCARHNTLALLTCETARHHAPTLPGTRTAQARRRSYRLCPSRRRMVARARFRSAGPHALPRGVAKPSQVTRRSVFRPLLSLVKNRARQKTAQVTSHPGFRHFFVTCEGGERSLRQGMSNTPHTPIQQKHQIANRAILCPW